MLIRPTRRALLGGAALLATPSILRAQTPEIFVGGPASPGLTDILFPRIEKKHGFKILFEGTNSLINLREDPQQPRPPDHDRHDDGRSGADPRRARGAARCTLRGLAIPNLADVQAEAKPRDAHVGELVLQPTCSSISYNTQNVKPAPASYAEVWDQQVPRQGHPDLDAHHPGGRAAPGRDQPRDRQAAWPNA